MIRALVAAMGGLAIVGSVAMFIIAPISWPVGLELDAFGLLILGSLAFERRYRGRRVAQGAQWESTGERFVDPTTGVLTEVRFNPVTGERAYVPADEHVGLVGFEPTRNQL